MKLKKIAFWATTGLFSAAMLASASMYLSQAKPLIEGFQHLGFPAYLIAFLGVAKLLGAAALLYRRWTTLTEWAYAGFTFNLLGAAYAHAMSGDPIANTLSPLVFLGVLGVSYALGKSTQSEANTQTRLQTAAA